MRRYRVKEAVLAKRMLQPCRRVPRMRCRDRSRRWQSAVQEAVVSGPGGGSQWSMRRQSVVHEAAVIGPGGGSQLSRRRQSAVQEAAVSGPGGGS
jgi:hypothetical protein